MQSISAEAASLRDAVAFVVEREETIVANSQRVFDVKRTVGDEKSFIGLSADVAHG